MARRLLQHAAMTRLNTMRMGFLGARLALLCLLGSSVTAEATELPGEEASSGWRLGVAAGVGHAYGLTGLQVQVRRGQFAAFLTAGYPGVPVSGGGIRWYSMSDRGLVLSLHGTHTLEFDPIEPSTVLAATVGWRFRWEPGEWKTAGHGLFAELGIGPAFFIYRGEDGVKRGFSALGGPDSDFLPDIALAVGFEW